MRIGFITTIDTNIGDDFIRIGIENIINSIIDPSEIKYTYVNKHKPETAILQNSPVHLLNKLPHFRGKHLFHKAYDRFFYHFYSVYRRQDLIIQSGAPVLWPGCYNNEWAKPIWYNTIARLKNKTPIINLAAGACYPWENQEGFMDRREASYAKDIGSFCRLTTTRDKLANSLFESIGVSNKLMPCTAFFVDKDFENKNEGVYILINYMEGGGHYDWGQNINKEKWESTIKALIETLKIDHEIRFICHNDAEVMLAEKLAPGIKCHLPHTVNEYIELIKHAKLGINNRMHASVAMASVGVPSLSICTDTRMLMLEHLGLPIYYVKDASYNTLSNDTYRLLNNFTIERNRLFAFKKIKFEEYKKIIEKFI